MNRGFLTRWARRKEAVRIAERAKSSPVEPGSEAAPAAVDPAVGLASAQPAGEAEEEPEVVAQPAGDAKDPLADLPRLETLTAGSDLAPFLRAGVPERLRNAALRRMWSLDPAIRDFVSEAREYAYDWNTPGNVPGLGPLLPTDDIEAMLSRLLNGRENRLVAPIREIGPDASAPDDAQTEPHLESLAELEVAARETVLPAADAVTPVPAAPDATPAIAVSSPAASKAEDQPARPRSRRHGGAMPS